MAFSSLRVHAASVTAHCKTNAEHYFHFLPFLLKVRKSSLDFFRLVKTGINVGLFIKAKWHKANFEERGYLYLQQQHRLPSPGNKRLKPEDRYGLGRMAGSGLSGGLLVVVG